MVRRTKPPLPPPVLQPTPLVSPPQGPLVRLPGLHHFDLALPLLVQPFDPRASLRLPMPELTSAPLGDSHSCFPLPLALGVLLGETSVDPFLLAVGVVV